MSKQHGHVLSAEPTNKELGELIIHLNSSTRDELRNEFREGLSQLGTELRQEMQEMRIELRAEIASTAENVIVQLSSQIQNLATYVDETCATKKELQSLDKKVDVVIQKQDLLFSLYCHE